MKDGFDFEDMKSIGRGKLGGQVPLELFRTIRLIGMYQALPMNGKSTTATIGRKIGESLPVSSVDDILRMFEELKIGIPSIVHQDEKGLRVAVDDCFCEGLPVLEGKMVCDLEGAILEGALNRVTGRKVRVREVKCNVSGDERCEYEVRYGL
ncbi:4-vinyl reductase [Saccharibacillus sp. CPCC 101409]|uniref:V4R domain-containing protein n=1 Tax=Saccharibacillus sp. CPCC 101409 TaxID=3058041 RepID=UPI002673E1EE|nr:V4R domain-containing protein [Saccharibacillus sp. CPCC 101409]MDO3412329.1 4-vinyl reductase [Saccharibacillus sp. CPCC 101409]